MQLDWVVGNHYLWKEVFSHIHDTTVGRTLSSASCIFVLGASGIGKTYHVRKILENHEVYSIDASNCSSSKEFRDMLIKGCNPYLMTRTETSKPFAILIDDMDILCHMDRTILSTLLDILSVKTQTQMQLMHVPIICMGLLDLERKLGNTKGKCNILKCVAPSDVDIYTFLKQQPNAKRKAKATLMKIAEDCNGNLHRALESLQALTAASTKKKVKTKQESGVAAANAHRQQQFATIKQEMLDDPWMNPLRYHENLPKILPASKEKREVYQEVLSYFGLWDRMMNHRENDPEVPIEILTHAICHYTPLGENARSTALDDFTKLLSNLSLQKKNERWMFPTWDHGFPWPHAQIFFEYSKQKWIT